MRRALLLVLAVSALAACDKRGGGGSGFSAPVAGSGDPGAASPTPDPGAPPVSDPAKAPSVGGATNKIFQQLATEKQNRPGIKPTAEDVLATLDRAGVKFDETKQVIGLTVGARYCVKSQSLATGLIVVVCEYGTAVDAEKSMQMVSDRYQSLMPNRTFTIKGTTSVQVVDTPAKPLPDVRRQIDEALATL